MLQDIGTAVQDTGANVIPFDTPKFRKVGFALEEPPHCWVWEMQVLHLKLALQEFPHVAPWLTTSDGRKELAKWISGRGGLFGLSDMRPTVWERLDHPLV